MEGIAAMSIDQQTDRAAGAARTDMIVEKDVLIPMPDGIALRADVFRPNDGGQYPAIMSHGPYAKDLAFQVGFPGPWDAMVERFPEVGEGTSNRYQAFEVADPEKWVPHGYAVVRVDSRGAARSPGVIDCFGPQETLDFYECIEWAGVQPWSNGKVGLSGISYYAVSQWLVAAKHPPHLAAICPWEGAADWYRDANYQGGIHSPFLSRWYPAQVEAVQHGLGKRGMRNEDTGVWISGDEELSDAELEANRCDIGTEVREHDLDDEYWKARSGDLEQIEVPVLSAGNWGGAGLHLRGNVEGFMRPNTDQRWLEIHGHPHWMLYYTDYGNELQRRFFDYFLKGEGDFPETQPRVELQIRRPGERFEERDEGEWPLARTEWKTTYLDLDGKALSDEVPSAPAEDTYAPFGEGLRLLAAPFEEETEVTGPLAAKLWISSTTSDADLFLVLHLFDADGEEVTFHGATEPKQPISLGWLRASHRHLDPARSKPYQPFHTHDRVEPLTPGEVYELDIEVLPTCIVAPAGSRLGLSILGRDWDHGGEGQPTHIGTVMKGAGVNIHDDPTTRPTEIYGGDVTVYAGGDRPSSLLVPIVPPKG
jgi:predicted acyl esterase